jgi:hypothetical protein
MSMPLLLLYKVKLDEERKNLCHSDWTGIFYVLVTFGPIYINFNFFIPLLLLLFAGCQKDIFYIDKGIKNVHACLQKKKFHQIDKKLLPIVGVVVNTFIIIIIILCLVGKHKKKERLDFGL